MSRLAGRIAVVAGASRGIGAAAAAALRAEGARVVRLARTLTTTIGDYHDIACDLTRPEAVTAAFDAVDGSHGSPSIVVAALGTFILRPFADTTPQDLDAQLDANLRAPFLVARAAVPRLRAAGGGVLVMVGSIADHVALPGNTAYAASKYGLRGLHETLVAELRGSSVRCTLVSPGPTDTSLWDPLDPDRRDDLPDRAAMLTPADVADAILFAVTRPPRAHVEWIRLGPA